ncbi:MAG: ABC transporter ATP-binding protein [Rhodoferax sp.]|nr:ABC transporter ATP-binding protein [Rhodoferax sp.]
MSALVLDGVSKQFGGLQAVSRLSMTVPPGHITGLIGPNGAGKTTVVNLITGVFKLSSGSVRFGDIDLTESPRHVVARAGIARTFQTIRLLPDATVLDNIMIGMYRHQRSSLLSQLFHLRASRSETQACIERAHALLRRFGMERYAAFPASTLSYGDQRRVEMMRALASEPRLLLLDEPVAGMNDVEARRLGDIFLELAQGGMAVLLIEHNIGFVSRICKHIVVLDSGRNIAEGSPDQILNNPEVIEAYLGSDFHA